MMAGKIRDFKVLIVNDNINGINRYHIPTINNNLGTRNIPGNYPTYSVQNNNNRKF